MADLPGMPGAVRHRRGLPLENTVPDDLPRWVGELYLLSPGHVHQPVADQRYNRKTETLPTRGALCALAHCGANYPQDASTPRGRSCCSTSSTTSCQEAASAKCTRKSNRYERAQDLPAAPLTTLDTVAGQIGGEGTGYLVFNTLGATSAARWSWSFLATARLSRRAGRNAPAHSVGGRRRPSRADRARQRARYGYRCYTVAPARASPPVAQPVEASAGALDNGLIRAGFDAQGRLVACSTASRPRRAGQCGRNQLWRMWTVRISGTHGTSRRTSDQG